MTILSSTSSLTWLLIRTMHAWGLVQAWGWVLRFLFAQTSRLFAYPSMFFFYLVHQSISSQGDPLHCDQPLDPTRTHLLSYSPGGEWIASYHMIRDAFASILEKKQGFMFRLNKHVSFHPLPFSLLIDRFTLCYQLITFAP